MCDKETEKLASMAGAINRRSFNKIMTLGALAALFPQFTQATDVVSSRVYVTTPDGTADGFFARPSTESHPAVIIWTDIKGYRPAFEAMAQRLASSGYGVLLLNPFYRDVKGSPLPKDVSFPSEEAWQILRDYRKNLTKDAVVRDTKAALDFLDKQTEVDSERGAAAIGYCMSGAFAMFAAAAVPDRIKAVASFHGGGLVTDSANSPHLTIADSAAHALHAIAEGDHNKSPQTKPALEKAYSAAKLTSIIKVYPGTHHGWTPPDSGVYNDVQAEAAWQDLIALLRHL